MTSDEKKAILLLKSVIFHYHGLDNEEKEILDRTAQEFDALEELQWANEFIATDYYTAFERARDYLNSIVGHFDKEKRLEYLSIVWDANNTKGFVTEMEATAMLKLAKDWSVQKELLLVVREKQK
ncbi:MAG: hypothetical protein EAZ44_03535 [Cytophagia bacterium]|nr:MAG: hypothetical protein EAY69_08005 [Cytophagales bacterium]TAG05283.1 MAG: hypothetical protein EAZ44_03535 [Cytophagia bacterium]TAG42500.1 MAG: hypothetical protein EAZ31_05965 [Cytophagia bacterium]TAH28700.1 MAG: hypothetical protein EAZ06_09125 [Cytophagales bacterium]